MSGIKKLVQATTKGKTPITNAELKAKGTKGGKK